MKILKSILYTAFALLICAEIIYAQDFKIAPNTPVPEESDFYNVSIASDINNGFLVTWVNQYYVLPEIDLINYACRISKTGEILDTTAIDIGGNPVHGWECPSAVFVGGNWIIASQQDFMVEWIGAVRLTPSGEILDTPPVNIGPYTGMSTILYPTIATNGQEILCVTSVSGEGIYGSIFDPDLNILVDRFLISEDWMMAFPKVSANGNNFFITFLTGDLYIKLVIVNLEGQILSTQDVCEEWDWPFQHRGVPAITTLNDVSYITFFYAPVIPYVITKPALHIRRYSSDGNPIDSSPVNIFESQDFGLFLEELNPGGYGVNGYTDLVWANECFRFFWPRVSDPGISMMSFKPDLSISNNQTVLLNSQCQIKTEFGGILFGGWSYSIIRASSIGDTVLTAWIDGREGNTRVYGNLFNVDEYIGIEQEENPIMIPEDFSISQNYPNPFNPTTTIHYNILKESQVTITIYDMLGKEINQLISQKQFTGNHSIQWDGTDVDGNLVSAGIYLYQLKAGNFVHTKKMLLLK